MQEQQHPFLVHETERQRKEERRFESWERMNYAWRAQKTAQNYRALNRTAEPTPSPPRSPASLRHNNLQYRNLSPASRTQAIARGQRELMEMVKNMPEACYELSLKDLVEQNQSHDRDADPAEAEAEAEAEEEEEEAEKNEMSSETELLEKRRSEDVVCRKGRVVVNNSNSNYGNHNHGGKGQGQGHMLKMVFPVSFGARKAKKTPKKSKKKNVDCENDAKATSNSNSNTNNNSSNNGVVDREWWKKRYSVAAEGDGDGLSSSSNSGGSKSSTTSGSRSSSLTSRSNSNNARHGHGGGCWWFIGIK